MKETFQFDQITPRRNTDSLKYDGAKKRGKPEDVTPLWVADMDFPTAPAVQDALIKVTQHGVFGYSEPSKPYYDALTHWFSTRFNYSFDPSWLVLTPGVVFAIATAISAFTKPQDAVMILEPVYYPFRGTILQNDRQVVSSNLLEEDGRYHIDFADFEAKIIAHQIKLFLFCSPHNPVGRVWTPKELQQLVAICKKHDVIIFSDEIHCDFVFGEHKHHVLPVACPDYADNIILATAPSKSFNIAGIHISNMFIPNKSLRQTFEQALWKTGFSQASLSGLVACTAAYRDGGAWFDALHQYIESNLKFIVDFFATHLPKVHTKVPEGTYLIWLDFRQFGLSDDEVEHKLLHEANIWLSRGDSFGIAGTGFMRLNAACPKSVLEDALGRICEVFQ